MKFNQILIITLIARVQCSVLSDIRSSCLENKRRSLCSPSTLMKSLARFSEDKYVPLSARDNDNDHIESTIEQDLETLRAANTLWERLLSLLSSFFTGENTSTDYPRRVIENFIPLDHHVIASKKNEDRMITKILKDENIDVKIYAVFDGHGKSAFVSQYLKVNFGTLLLARLPYYSSTKKLATLEVAELVYILKHAIIYLDTRICDRYSEKAFETGSTASIALVIKDVLFTINLGDSRVLLNINDNHFSTVDHKPNEEEDRINDAGGFVEVYGVPRVNGILAVSRAFGDCALKRRGKYPEFETMYDPNGWLSAYPIVEAYRLRNSGSVGVMLGTDGVWDVVDSEEAWDIVDNGHPSPAKVLALRAQKRGSTDDITVIVDKIKFN